MRCTTLAPLPSHKQPSSKFTSLRGVTEHNLELGPAGRLSLAVLHMNRFAMFSPSGFAVQMLCKGLTTQPGSNGKWECKTKKNNISINKSSASLWSTLVLHEAMSLHQTCCRKGTKNSVLPQPMWGKSSARFERHAHTRTLTKIKE